MNLAAEELNPLIPHVAEIVLGIVVFLILVFLIGKFVVPNFEKAFSQRTAAIEGGMQKAEQAQAEAKAALETYTAQLAEARHEAGRIREEAREQGAQIIAELRQQAQTEAERIVTTAHAQVEADRQQALQQLRSEVGALATTLAGRIVGESLEDEARQRRTVERFIAEIEEQGAPAGDRADAWRLRRGPRGDPRRRRPAGARRSGRDRARRRPVRRGGRAGHPARVAAHADQPLHRGGGEVRAGEPAVLRQDRSTRPTPSCRRRGRSLEQGPRPRRRPGGRRRRGAPGRRGAHRRARGDRGRAVPLQPGRARRPRAARALSDPGLPRKQKRDLVGSLLEGGQARPATVSLVKQAVAARRRAFELTIEDYVETAASRRDQLVATVRAAYDLGLDERDRLASALQGVYGKPVHLNVVVEPALLGGATIEIGDELIDSSVAGRLEQARRKMTG
jgi:F-type H+-transporting ATPase subunit b